MVDPITKKKRKVPLKDLPTEKLVRRLFPKEVVEKLKEVAAGKPDKPPKRDG